MIYNQGMPVNYAPPMMPQGYQYAYAPNMQQNFQQNPQQNQQAQQNIQQPQQQIQQGGFITVRSIDEARQWAVVPGNSITFKIEGTPFICEKTMGFSNLESPRFEVFRLVKENNTSARSENATQSKLENAENSTKPPSYVSAEDFNALSRKVAELEDGVRDMQQKVESFVLESDEKSNYNSNVKSNKKKTEDEK